MSFVLVRKRCLSKSLGASTVEQPGVWPARERRRTLDEGVYRNRSELAFGEGVSTAAVGLALAHLRRAVLDLPE